MHSTIGRHGQTKLRAAADVHPTTHPAWRKLVAGSMVIVFALTLAVMGLMLCVAPAATP